MLFLRSILCLGLLCTTGPMLFASGTQAIESAAQEGKYLFVFFYKESNEKTAQLQSIFDQAMQKLGAHVQFVKVNVKDPAERTIVDRFNMKRSPMPFVVAIAPNGAITGGFTSFTEDQLLSSMASQGAAKCLKALQDKKLVLLCLQNNQTTDNEAALKGAKEFKTDPRYATATEIVMIDPKDQQEQGFLNQLSIDLNSSQATTVLISPPAEIVGTYRGAITKDKIASDLQCAASGCCGPGGCCPGGKCCPR